MSTPNTQESGLRQLFEEAKQAAAAGDHQRARTLLEQVLGALPPNAAEARAVALSELASVLAAEGRYEQAMDHWERVLVLCDETENARGRSFTLDKMAQTSARHGRWQRACALWEQALIIDTRLGSLRDRVATLASLAQAVARSGDLRRAHELWSEALTFYGESADARGAAAILSAMGSTAAAIDDWSDPLGLRRRALALCERQHELRGVVSALDGLGHEALQRDPQLALSYWQRAHAGAEQLGDRLWASVLLASTASCLDAVGDTARALELWSRAVVQLDELGAERHRDRVMVAIRAARARTSQSPSRHKPFSLSEYDLAPAAAPLFGVGELLAALHGLGRRVGALSPDDLGVAPNGLVWVSPTAKLPVLYDLELESTAHDLLALLDRYPAESAATLLAGYVRGAYETIDGAHPGYTESLLARLEIPEPWPRPAASPLEIPAILRDLGVELRAGECTVELHVDAVDVPREIWRRAPHDAFQVVLALLLAGVDCRQLFARDSRGSVPPTALYRVLFPDPPPEADIEADARRLAALAPGLELAVGLGRALRNLRLPEPLDLNHVLFWLRKTLLAEPEEQAVRFGDIMIATAQHCARAAGAISEPRIRVSATQLGIIALEYVSRGRRTDEGRLIAAARSLHDLPGHPQPGQPWPDAFPLHVVNSWLITLRELAGKSAAEHVAGRPGMLRSAAVRALPLARHALRHFFGLASSREPESATAGHAFLRVTVKNHANLLTSLARSAEHDKKSTGQSGWLPYFWQGSTTGHLGAELAWIGRFFDAAARDGFTLDVARSFMQEGHAFLSVENTFVPLPPLRSAGVS